MKELIKRDRAVVHHADTLEWSKRQPDNSIDLTIGSSPYENARTYGIDFDLSGSDFVAWARKRFLEHYRITRGVTCWVLEGVTEDFRWSATPAMLMTALHNSGVNLRKPPIFHRVGIPGSGGPDWWRNDYEFCICATKPGKLPWSDNTATGHIPKWAPGGEMSNRTKSGKRVNQFGAAIGSSAESDEDGSRSGDGRPGHYEANATEGRDEFGFCGSTSNGRKKDGEPKPRKAIRGSKEGDTILGEFTPPVLANPGNVIRATYTLDEVRQLLNEYGVDDDAMPEIVKCIVGGGVMGSKLTHKNEAPFPESLVEPFVKCFSPPDGLVYDPFSGSGTTGAVCIKNGRRFVGTDIRESQVALTNRRFEEAFEAISQMNLF